MTTFSCRLTDQAHPLHHHWTQSIGSGHATLALRADWQGQLARAHRELGVRHVRFHGILSDDVGTRITVEDRPLFSFFNADAIMDFLAGIGMAPLVELSFMPQALASGDTRVFRYRGNVTPPREPAEWTELIGRLVGHWHHRYGRDRMLDWLFEVWNEPNLPAFWTGTQAAYFDLYERTARAIKAVDPELRVGGPATAMCAWLPEFIAFCEAHHVPCDFISTHYYPTDALGTITSDTISQLAGSSRHAMRETAQRARSAAFGRPLMLTEWSITSNPRDIQHDEPIAAVYLVKAALEMAPFLDGSSWWTFSDIFEENYMPSKPFHGGFGLLSLHGVAKPSYRAMQLLSQIGDRQLPVRGGHATVDCWGVLGEHRLDLITTNLGLPRQQVRNQSVTLRVDASPRPVRVLVRRIDADHANARREWVELGQPESLDCRQLDRLHAASALRDEEVAWHWDGGTITVDLTIPANGVAMVTCEFTPEDPPLSEVSDTQEFKPGSADTAMLEQLQRESFSYFPYYVDPHTGQTQDGSSPDSPVSIAATGMALTCYPIAVEHRWMTRSDAASLTHAAIRFLRDAPQGPQQDATGFHGFFYHFLHPQTGRRTWDCELSTMDTALLIAGALTASAYFDGDTAIETEIREGAAELYGRIDWRWALAGGPALSMGWHPVRGFIPYRWQGYSEAMLLYALALGAASPIGPESYQAWCRTYTWRQLYGIEHLYAGPLFIHQLSHCWIDFRAIRDEPMRAHGLDYYENSRRATQVQQRYAMENPRGFRGYAADCWGITACEGPGPARQVIDGVERTFDGYVARGVPDGPDDGTLAPWAVIASLPFAPEIVLPTIRRFNAMNLRERAPHGFKTTFNQTFHDGPRGWSCAWHYGLNQGPAVIMIENQRSELIWRLIRSCRPIVAGLRRAGFTGGWLDEAQGTEGTPAR